MVGLSALNAGAAPETASTIDFTRDIRPILSDYCFACHGPDEAQRKAKLRLDTREGAFAERKHGPAIVPRDPAKSALMARITTADREELMPPPESGKSLSATQIELLRRWIAEGADWRQHWSFVPVRQPELPALQNPARARNPVDHFIQQRLQREGLAPNPEADRATLLRRVSLDLTGLPPTLEETRRFTADTSPDAYEQIVDRLLASPRFGERMALFWLDAARYGDTHGLHLDNYREMWPYRDWVVNAFNRNLPFDQFVIEQLAGDLLENPTPEQLIATGFNRCHVTTAEGGSIDEEVHIRNVVDRVVTTGTVFLGLTMDCTRCHNHKFDPLTMEDFYSMSAFFNSLDGPAQDGNRKDHAPVVQVPSEEQRARLAALKEFISRDEAKLKADWPVVDAEQAAWEIALRKSFAPDPAVFVAHNFAADTLEAAHLEADQIEAAEFEAGPVKISGFKADRFEGGHVKARGLKAASVRLRPVPDRASSSNQLATVSLGDWYSVGPFNDVERYLRSRRHGPEGKPIDLQQEFETETGQKLKWRKRPEFTDGKVQGDLPGDMAANFLYRKILSPKDQKVTLSLGSDDGIKVFLNHQELLSNIVNRGAAPDQETVELPLRQGENHLLLKIINLGDASGFYFAIKSQVQSLPEPVYQLALNTETPLDDTQKQQLRDHYRNQVSTHPDVLALKKSLEENRKSHNELDRAIPTTLVWRESKEPKEAFLLKRGQYDQRGEKVARRTPAVLPPMDASLPHNRLGFARWLLDDDHPLTARVTVNRFWQQFFGTGLVRTSEDFGSQGEPPSHPELLDWLAATFRESGWDVKGLVKLLVTSATYRQSSRLTPELLQRDPADRLLARSPRLRLDAEQLRDNALFVGGLLDLAMGGPGVKPYQPPNIWEPVGFVGSNTREYKQDTGAALYRRSLYTFLKRTAPPPFMATFDAPNREQVCTRRERSNTPLQALQLMNDVQYFEAARALAQRMMTEGGSTPEERFRFAFETVLARPPSDEERQLVRTAFHAHLARYAADAESARQAITYGESKPPETLPAPELAAYTLTANLLLNLDETITRN